MASLIEELQRDALDSKLRVGDLLRKAKTIAVKLDLPELEKWVENEMNGYPATGSVPNYRIVFGSVKGHNIFYGWQPVIFNDSETEKAFAKRQIFQKVAELENVVASYNGHQLTIPFSAEAKRLLMSATGSDEDFTLMVAPSAVVGILDSVRNALLEWALKLEKSGIRGEGMSFSQDERKKAHETQAVYNIGTIQTFTGNMGSGSGNFTVEGNVINADSQAAIQSLIEKIQASKTQLGLAPQSSQELNHVIVELQQEMKERKPNASRVKDFLASIRNIAEGAAGSLVAQGILYELSKLAIQ